MKLFGTMEAKNKVLHIGGVSVIDLVENFHTPLYVIDEALVRDNCKSYMQHFKTKENNNRVAYAGKAFLTKAMCKIIDEEGLYLDVVSGGELYTADKSNFPMERILFHGNNKTLDEINMGITLGVGRFVVDNFYEIENINEIAKGHSIVQKVYLRVTPGIEAHTHDYIKTGQIDSKFGFTIINDDLIHAVKKINSLTNIEIVGIHAHIGSQIFDIKPYEDEVEIMMGLMKKIYEETGTKLTELDLGGGFGIYYTEVDDPSSFEAFCSAILKKAEETVNDLGISMPILTIEPGRSIIGNAGSTLYTIGSIKEIPGIRKYVSVDGGMTDNIRPSLYNANYECDIANKMHAVAKEKVTIAGKCCESGDILLTDIDISDAISGDILIIPTTGAYGYSMSSNYNKIPKAAVVMVKDMEAKVICKRQSYEDLLALEV